MAAESIRLMVGVFDLRERAEHSAAQLLAAGHRHEAVVVAESRELPEWAANGMAAEAKAYYTDELRAGRTLVIVTCHPDDAGAVLGAFGRHGGAQRVPVEIREGRC